jgi:hypothetical protein
MIKETESIKGFKLGSKESSTSDLFQQRKDSECEKNRKILKSSQLTSTDILFSLGGSTAQNIETKVSFPFLLSKIARLFKALVFCQEKVSKRNNIVYQSCFSGQEAIDILTYIIGSVERSTAFSVGQSLFTMEYYNEVTKEGNVFSDSPDELYAFSTRYDDDNFPEGFISQLSPCYSPTCENGGGCYSPFCVKTKQLNIPPAFRKNSKASNPNKQTNNGETLSQLWSNVCLY